MSRRRFFWGLAAATAALAIVAGSGTFGFFSSTTVNPGNSFFAGTLVLANNKNGTFILDVSNMQPGDVVARQVELSYDPRSSLDMNYSLSRTSMVEFDAQDPANPGAGMCAALALQITEVSPNGRQLPNDGGFLLPAPDPAGTVTSSTISSFTFAGPWSLNNSGNPDDTYNFQVTFVDTGVPQNHLQGDGCTVEYTWSAVQQATNDDITGTIGISPT